MCPLIQNDNLPPDPVAWRHRFARLGRAEAAASLPEQRADEDPVLGSCDRGQGVATHRENDLFMGDGVAFVRRG